MLKVGDNVWLTDLGVREWGRSNRLTRNNVGKIIVVKGRGEERDMNYEVVWDTRHENSYRNCDLELVDEENE